MKPVATSLVLAAAMAISVTAAEAKPARASAPDMSWAVSLGLHRSDSGSSERATAGRSSRSSEHASYANGLSWGGGGGHSVGPRPSQWCGWWMRTQRGGGPEYNLAANWRHYGRPASPQVGAVVVWDHHVGQIVGRAPNGQWLVQSGNDSGAVRTRARSIAGATVRM